MERLMALIIEDSPTMQTSIEIILSSLEIDAMKQGNLHDGLAAIDTGVFDLVMLDLSLPDSEYPIQTALKVLDRTKILKIPVIVLTATENRSLALEVVQMGASGYAFKTDIGNLRDQIVDLVNTKNLFHNLDSALKAYDNRDPQEH